MAALPYEYYIDIVTKRYFHGVDNFDMNLVLDCFHEDAVLTEQTSMTVHEGRETHLCALGHASPRARVHAPEVALDGVLAVPVRDEAATRVQQLLRLVQDRPLPHADQERPLALIAGESRYTSPLGGAGVGDLHPPLPRAPRRSKC